MVSLVGEDEEGFGPLINETVLMTKADQENPSDEEMREEGMSGKSCADDSESASPDDGTLVLMGTN